jgi:hypothetical protein
MKTMQRNPPKTLFHNVWVKKQFGSTRKQSASMCIRLSHSLNDECHRDFVLVEIPPCA